VYLSSFISVLCCVTYISVKMSLCQSNCTEETSRWNYLLHEYWKNESDPRIASYPLFVDGPGSMLCIMTTYLLFVKVLGPYLMRNRNAFELRREMLIYNTFLVFINAYFFVEGLICLEFGKALIHTEFPNKNDYSKFTIRCIDSAYWYYLTKYIDLLDTVFFVLRKKHSQVTFLHLYHHITVPTLGWVGMKVGPTIPGLILFAVLNTFIHVIMYSYYALSAFGPKVQKYLWWKKYLTQIQMVQFIILGLYGTIVGQFLTGYKSIYFYMGVSQPPIYLCLFYDFYYNSYKSPKKTRETKQ